MYGLNLACCPENCYTRRILCRKPSLVGFGYLDAIWRRHLSLYELWKDAMYPHCLLSMFSPPSLLKQDP
jgi:hypothetical protein